MTFDYAHSILMNLCASTIYHVYLFFYLSEARGGTSYVKMMRKLELISIGVQSIDNCFAEQVKMSSWVS